MVDIPQQAMDDQLVAEAHMLATLAIREAIKVLSYGSPQQKLAVVKSLMPSVGRALAERSEAEDLAEMRAQLQTLNQRLLSA